MLYCIDAPKPGDADGVIWFWKTNTKGKGENAMKPLQLSALEAAEE